MVPEFELFLFSVDPDMVRQAVAGGVSAIIVDWEVAGKERRQAGQSTEINHHSSLDLDRVRRSTDGTVVCRVNGFGRGSEAEIEAAISAGVDEILLPMVRTPREVIDALDLVRGRCGVGILVETVDALGCLPELAALPLRRVYVGLNDLAIERRTESIFAPLADGLLAEIRSHFPMPFGFGGITVPEGGCPIPAPLLMAEMTRLDARFSFLRRSFHADVAGRDVETEVRRIQAHMAGLAKEPAAGSWSSIATILSAIKPL